MKKRFTEEQQLIREITGNGKYLQLNLDLISKLGLTESALITFVLDKMEYWISLGKINQVEEGVVIYRKELEEKFGLSNHLQRKAENTLKELEILHIETFFDGKERFNKYSVSLENLINIMYEGS